MPVRRRAARDASRRPPDRVVGTHSSAGKQQPLPATLISAQSPIATHASLHSSIDRPQKRQPFFVSSSHVPSYSEASASPLSAV